MSGIDTSAAALQANRLAALQPVGARPGAGAMQTGVSALAGGVANLPDVSGMPQQQQASTQTELSAVALALDAIQRSGGEATPAVVGTAPVWPTPQQVRAIADSVAIDLLAALAEAADAAGASVPTSAGAAPDGGAAANGAAQAAGADGGTNASNASNPANASNASNASSASSAASGTGAAAQATAAGAADPVAAALAASLQRTVSGSGLFYESHLAQWLIGQRSPAELAAEPQNRLVASAAAQLPLNWQRGAGEADDVFWTDPHLPDASQHQADAARAAAPAQTTLFDDLLDVVSAPLPAPSASGASGDAVPVAANAQGQPVAVHPAVIPLLRQQLDVLATGEFRWTGEAWPGVRLDWSIRQENDDARRGHAAPDADQIPWRTRLTLSLPSLGIVDAELTLVGATLAVRVQASGDGAARLAANGEALRGRMAAAGIELGGLTIREVGGAAPGGGADAARAAHAYATAAARDPAPADAPAAVRSEDDFDWEAR